MASPYLQVVLEPRASIPVSMGVSISSIFLPIFVVTVKAPLEN
jgi:hypothetical protein